MQACALASLVVFASCECVLLRRTVEPIAAHHKEELTPLVISCRLNDIITISAPIRYKTKALYYLYRPNSDVTELDISSPEEKPVAEDREENEIIVKYKKNDDKYMTFSKNYYKINNVNFGYKITDKREDVFGGERNEFVIGPLGEDDCGNWVLSIYAKENGEWVEWFQVITIDIVELIPTEPLWPVLSPGDTFELQFAYPVKNLESCQLTVPGTSYDRFYERLPGDTCKFVIRNVTSGDNGKWRILGVGRIAYSAITYLKVKNKIT